MHQVVHTYGLGLNRNGQLTFSQLLKNNLAKLLKKGFVKGLWHLGQILPWILSRGSVPIDMIPTPQLSTTFCYNPTNEMRVRLTRF